MKKATILVILTAIILLSGCGNGKTATLKLSGISFDADIILDGARYTAECKTDKKNNLDVRIISPEPLKGLAAAVTEEKHSISFGGAEIENEDILFPGGFPPDAIYRVLKKYDGQECKFFKENLKLSGETDGIGYSFTVSPAGLPILLTMPQSGLSISFNNLVITE